MLQTTSGDGKFIISVPDNAKSLLNADCNLNDSDYDDEMDVYLEAVEEVDLYDLAEAILGYCFNSDGQNELSLLATTLNCHVTVGNKKYEFTVDSRISLADCTMVLATQFEL